MINPTPSVSSHPHLRNPFARHHHSPRRRSLDNPEAMTNQKPNSRSSSPTRKQELPYPRGGRQIGAEPPQPLSRSNSGERRQFEANGQLPFSIWMPLFSPPSHACFYIFNRYCLTPALRHQCTGTTQETAPIWSIWQEEEWVSLTVPIVLTAIEYSTIALFRKAIQTWAQWWLALPLHPMHLYPCSRREHRLPYHLVLLIVSVQMVHRRCSIRLSPVSPQTTKPISYRNGALITMLLFHKNETKAQHLAKNDQKRVTFPCTKMEG